MTHLDDETLAEAEHIIRVRGFGAPTDTQLLRFARAVVRLRASIEDARAVLADWTGPVWGDDAYIRVRLRVALGPAGADPHNCAQLRATIDAVAAALAGDGQAVLKVAAAQQVLIDADRQEQHRDKRRWALDFNGTHHGPFDSKSEALDYGSYLAGKDLGPIHEYNAIPLNRPEQEQP